jgi:hypothetical protein
LKLSALDDIILVSNKKGLVWRTSILEKHLMISWADSCGSIPPLNRDSVTNKIVLLQEKSKVTLAICYSKQHNFKN